MLTKDKKEEFIKEFVDKLVLSFPELKGDIKYEYNEKDNQFIISHHNYNLHYNNTGFYAMVRSLTRNILYSNEVLNFSFKVLND